MEIIDTQVSNHLARCLLPSVPSVVILRSKWLLRFVTEPEIRIAMIRRILRYVSPRLWGSVQAEAYGDHKRLSDIADKVWTTRPASSRRTFSGGANVTFIPGVVTQLGTFKPYGSLRGDHTRAWLVQRGHPLPGETLKRLGLQNHLVRDITDLILGPTPPEGWLAVFYDSRFHISLNLHAVPEDVLAALQEEGSQDRIVIRPATDWYAPQIVWLRKGRSERVLSDYRWNSLRWAKPVNEFARHGRAWVRMEFVRTIGAI